MAIPAAPPPPPFGEPAPRRGSRPVARRAGRRVRRPGRLGGALVAVVTGMAILGVGLARTAGGLGSDPALAGGGGPPSISGGASPPASVAAVATPAPSGSVPPAPPASVPPASAPPIVADAERLGVELQAELDRLRVKLAIPGATATILFPDGSSWTGASGLADVAARAPVTADTAFAYASVSKTFTSALILQLVGEGRIRLTDSAAALLPPLRIAIDRRITVEMLLDHTSGLADFFLNPKIDRPLQRRPSDAWSVERTLGYVGKRLSPPGKAWHYSNTNYVLLGLIAERVTGQSLAAAIRGRLLDPIGLGATWTQSTERPLAPLAHAYRLTGTKLTAKPIDLDDGTGIAPFRSVVTAAGGAGAMAGTSDDLARWGRALYGGRVLGPEGTALLLSQFRETVNYQPGVVYGYGIQALSIDGHASLGHSGRFLGARASLRHFPIEGLTIAVLVNQSRADPAVILRRLLAVSAPPAPPCVDCHPVR
jgi:D-alanyl-D-alanine carboxypeptidase